VRGGGVGGGGNETSRRVVKGARKGGVVFFMKGYWRRGKKNVGGRKSKPKQGTVGMMSPSMRVTRGPRKKRVRFAAVLKKRGDVGRTEEVGRTGKTIWTKGGG